jgi:hypothetical protein
MVIKKILIIVIAVVLVAGVCAALAGCGNKNDPDAVDTGVTSEASDSGVTSATSAAAGSTTAAPDGSSAALTSEASATSGGVTGDISGSGSTDAADASQGATADQTGNGGASQNESGNEPKDMTQHSAALAAAQRMTIEVFGEALDAKPSVNNFDRLVLPLEDICEPAGWEFKRAQSGSKITYTLIFAGKAESTMTVEYTEKDGKASNQVYKLGKQALTMFDDLYLVDGKPYMPFEYFEIMQMTVEENKTANKIILEYK